MQGSGDFLAVDGDGQGDLLGVEAILHLVAGAVIGVGVALVHHAEGRHGRAAPGGEDHVRAAGVVGLIVVGVDGHLQGHLALEAGALAGLLQLGVEVGEHLHIGGVVGIDAELDFDGGGAVVDLGSHGLVVGNLHQFLGGVHVVTGHGVIGLVQGGVVAALAPGQAVQLDQAGLGIVAVAIGLAGEGVVDVHVVQQAEAGSASGGVGSGKLSAVQGQGEGLAEFVHHQNLAARAAGQQLLIVGVEGHLGGVGLGRVLDVLAGGIGGHVGGGQTHGVNLAGQEGHQLGRLFLDDVDLVDVGLVHAQVLAVVVAVPVLVAVELDLLIHLEVRDLVGAVADGLLHGGAVVGVHGSGGFLVVHSLAVGIIEGLAGLVQGLVDQPGAGQVVGHIEGGFLHGALQDQVDGVVIDLLQANLVPGRALGDGGGVQVLAGIGLVGSAGSQIVVIQILGGHPGLVGSLVFDGRVAVHGVVVDGDVLLSGVALSVQSAHAAPEVHVQIHFLTGGQQVGGSLGDQVIGGLAGVEVVLRVDNHHVAGIVAVGAAVEHLGVQLLLHGVDVVVGGDLLAVLPAGVGIQGDTPGLGGFAFSHAELAHILARHVHGVIRGHFGQDGIAVLVLVQVEAVEANGHHAQHGVVVIGFPGVGVPVHAVGAAQGIHQGVHLLVGIVLALFTGIAHGVDGAAALAGGGQHDLARVERALAHVVAVGGREGCSFSQRGHAGQSHGQRQDDGNDLPHLCSLLFFILLWFFHNRFIYYTQEKQ